MHIREQSVVHTFWFRLNRLWASCSMYFLSVSVSLATPLCACQVRAMRKTRMYSDSTVVRVEAVIGAPNLRKKTKDTCKIKFLLHYLFVFRPPHRAPELDKLKMDGCSILAAFITRLYHWWLVS